MVRRSAELRARLLAEFSESGLSAAQFCLRRGINEQTFSYWRRQLIAAPVASTPPSQAALFREITPAAVVPGGDVLHLRIGVVRLTLRSGFDAGLLRAVVEALR